MNSIELLLSKKLIERLGDRYDYSNFWCGYVTVYSLTDLDGNVFYVGITTNPLEARLKTHIAESKSKKYRGNQIKSKKIRSLRYKIRINELEKVYTTARKKGWAFKNAFDYENKWINHFREQGIELTNIFPRISNAA